MSYVKTIVCLANSYNPPNGRCIAGGKYFQKAGDWIRPVSARPTAEVSFSEYRYENNASPKLLDIVDVPLLDAEPRHHQVENHVIDSGQRWVKRDELPFEALEELCDPASLWINSDSTNAGCYDYISQAEAATVHDSLLLIKPREFLIE